MNLEPSIDIRDLTKTFAGGRVAVSGLDLSVPPGSVFGLIGRNGAGKSTALRLLMGLLRPDQGRALVLGCDLSRSGRSARARVAYVPQAPSLPGGLSVEALGRYVRPLYPRWNQADLLDRAGAWGLDVGRPVGRLSGGEQRKAALLLAVCARPDVLVLDEPAAGLDPVARRQWLDLMVERMTEMPESTLLVSTHHIADLARVADRVGVMDRGRLARCARVEDLQARVRKVQAVFNAPRPPEGFRLPGALRQETAGPVVTGTCEIESDRWLDEIESMPGVRVQSFALGLEEIFVELFEQPGAGPFSSVRAPLSSHNQGVNDERYERTHES